MLAHGIEKGKKIMKTVGANSILSFAPVDFLVGIQWVLHGSFCKRLGCE